MSGARIVQDAGRMLHARRRRSKTDTGGSSSGEQPPLRIAMISYYMPGGSKIGVGYQVHELANELVRRGHSVDVFSECPPTTGALYGHWQVHLAGPLRTFRFATSLRAVDFSAYDVLHAHGDDYWLWRQRALVHIRTMHGSCFEEALRIRGFKQRVRMCLLGVSEVLATLVADKTVAVSPATRRWTPWVRAVIPNGVSEPFYRSPGGRRSTNPSILFVGAWKGRKRGKELASIFATEVKPHVPTAELVMVTRDAPANLDNSIQILGEVSQERLVEAYAQAWVFCLPSAYEGFGIPYAEAMAAGAPVVATPNIGARFVTQGGRSGKLVQLEGLGDALTRLLTDEVQRSQLAQRGSERAEHFRMSGVAMKYEELYRAIGDRPGGAEL